MGDQMRLQQILISLTDNALKFTDHGSVQIRGQVESSEKDNVILRFSVQDTGIGMTMEELEQIFQPFSQVDASRTRRHGGIGLGLTVAKSLVEVLGGRIWCESEPQRGSIFFFTAAFKLPENVIGAIAFPETFQDLPILLVEDNKVNQIVATKMWEAKGFQVDLALDGLQAVEMVKQKEYALILMDIQMPEMDGIEATRVIRSDPKFASLPIVALTANAMEDDQRHCLEAGMNDFIAKPINPVFLYQTILKWAKPVKTS
jgi:CheY-like chemotaxis protein